MKTKTYRFFALAAFLLTTASSAFAYRNSAWIPPWDANALTSIQTNLGVLNETNPVWYCWNADGSIARNWNAENPSWRAAMTGTQLMPTIQNAINGSFNSSTVAMMLARPQTREAHAAAIAQLVDANAFDGIDIDYELIPTASRANYTAFLATLAEKLHISYKKLSVTVYAKTSDSQNWDGPGAEDYAAIGQIADSVKIMAFDYSYTTSAPGPITPLAWLDQVATYAQSVIPNSKIMMGLPWYGYNWSSGAPAATMSYAAATQLALNNNARITHDANGEAMFTYADHTVYFQDASSYNAKVKMLKRQHAEIGGFAAWAPGVEDPAVWLVLRDASTPTNPPSMDYTISGPTALTVAAGTSIAAQYRVVAVNGFVGLTNAEVIAPWGFIGSARFDSSIVGSGRATMLRVTPAISTMPGVYRFTVRFTSGTLTHDQIVSVTVTKAARRRVTRQ